MTVSKLSLWAAFGCLCSGLSVNAVEVSVETSAIPFFSNLDRDGINRMEETAFISGDGSRIVYVDNCTRGTSLSGLLSYDTDPADMGAIKVYDVAGGDMRTLYDARYGNRAGGGVSHMDAYIAADITGDGQTIVAAIQAISVGESGGEPESVSRVIKVVTINASTGALTEITQFGASGYSDIIALRASADGSHALIAAFMPTGETTRTWGVEYAVFGDTYELLSVPLTAGAQATLLTDPEDDYGLGTYRGVRYSFDLSDNGERIIYSQVDKGSDKTHIATSLVGGGNKVVVASGIDGGEHVTISGDGTTIAYCDWNDGNNFDDDEIFINATAGGQERLALTEFSAQYGMLVMNHSGSALAFTSSLGGDRWYFSSFHLLVDGGNVIRTDLSKGSLSASGDLSVVLTQNDDSPLYLSRVTVSGGGGGGATGIDFIDTAADAGDGWHQSEWFGFFQKGDFPYVYHYEHGWIYFGPGSETGVTYFDKCLRWVYTSKAIYPWMHSYYDGDWNYFYRTTVTPNRWWYSTLYDQDYLEFTWDD